MRGRKPKPTAVKIASGNPGKRRLNTDEPKPDLCAPEPPPHLAGQALKLWWQLTPELTKLGMMAKIDVVALATYCDTWALYLRACRELEKAGGPVYISDKGNPIQSPWVGIANTQSEMMRKLGVEFGFTPSSRSRVKAPSPTSPEDELNDFIGGAPAMKIAN